MFFFLVALTIISSVHSAHVNSVHTDVIGGNDVDIENYSYQVALIKDNELWCGGAIVSTVHVLTAGHCVTEANDYRHTLIVRSGSSYWDNGGTLHNVKSADVYVPDVKQYQAKDIAVVTVRQPFLYSIARYAVKLGCDELQEGVFATFTGWGSIGGGKYPNQLNAVDLRTADQYACASAYAVSGYGAVSESEMCAGNENQAVCYGDYGGPLVFNGYIMAVSTFSHGCGDPDFPGVFTYVGHFRNWIKDIIGEKRPDIFQCI